MSRSTLTPATKRREVQIEDRASQREAPVFQERSVPAVHRYSEDTVTETTLKVLQALLAENEPLSRRGLHVRTGLPLEDIGEALVGLRRSGEITALNTVVETFMAVEPSSNGGLKGFTHSLPGADTSSIGAPHTLL